MKHGTYFNYSDDRCAEAIFPLGGIGAGAIGIGADGRLRNWEIFNRPDKGSVNGFSHFAVKAEQGGQVIDTRVLHGPFKGCLTGDFLGQQFNSYGFGARREHMVGFPSFEACEMEGPYPVARLRYQDSRFPGEVSLEALSPYLPVDSRSSSMPLAMFEFEITNSTDAATDYTLFGCVGYGFSQSPDVNVVSSEAGKSIIGQSTADPASPDYAELCISTNCEQTSHQHHFYRGTWYDALEVYWQDISAPGTLKDRSYGAQAENRMSEGHAVSEHSTLACHVTLSPGETRKIKVALAWYVPNFRKYWISLNKVLGDPKPMSNQWKNFYATQWDSAQDVATNAFASWETLFEGTKKFQNALSTSSMPTSVLDAVSANLSTLKSPTVLRLEDGTFYGWEGCHPDAGSCEGSCTHVWNYQQTLPFLFPDLERSMRDADFANNQTETGGMAYRLSLPLGVGVPNDRPCVDGQFGNVLKTYRDWKLSGDTDWLRALWPNIKAAIRYAWHPDNYDHWDPDKTGVITGRQHHTLDMEMFGPSGWLNGFYLGALKAGAAMADAVEDTDAAVEFREVFDKGYLWTKENLFNGEYFVQKVDLSNKAELDPYLSNPGPSNYVKGTVYDLYWSEEHQQLKYQMGDGCEIDQVLAQWHANIYGLGDLFEPDAFKSSVNAIYKHNFKERLGDFANPCRIFGLEDDAGTVMCAWPDMAERPVIPLPYSQETMHGFEYAFATQLMMVEELEKAVQVFAAVRDRYRGHNRNPWNEIECGSHYARSMASFAAVPVLSGFVFDLPKGQIAFDPIVQDEGGHKMIWAAAGAWGTMDMTKGQADFTIVAGQIALRTLTVCGVSTDVATPLNAGDVLTVSDPAIDLTSLPDIALLTAGKGNAC